MNLVQIGLPRAGARAASPVPAAPAHEAAEDDHAAATDDGPEHSLLPASAGLALAGGLILLAPLATHALASRATLVLLLIGLGGLGLIAALLRPGLIAEDRP